MYALIFKRCKLRYILNGMWRQPLCVTRLTIARALSDALPFALLPFFSRQAFLFSFVRDSPAIVYEYLARNFFLLHLSPLSIDDF